LGPTRSPRISTNIADANDLVEFTLLKAYVGADRLDDARRMLSGHHRGSASLPVAGLTAVH
jgi:hypothetical protein